MDSNVDGLQGLANKSDLDDFLNDLERGALDETNHTNKKLKKMLVFDKNNPWQDILMQINHLDDKAKAGRNQILKFFGNDKLRPVRLKNMKKFLFKYLESFKIIPTDSLNFMQWIELLSGLFFEGDNNIVYVMTKLWRGVDPVYISLLFNSYILLGATWDWKNIKKIIISGFMHLIDWDTRIFRCKYIIAKGCDLDSFVPIEHDTAANIWKGFYKKGINNIGTVPKLAIDDTFLEFKQVIYYKSSIWAGGSDNILARFKETPEYKSLLIKDNSWNSNTNSQTIRDNHMQGIDDSNSNSFIQDDNTTGQDVNSKETTSSTKDTKDEIDPKLKKYFTQDIHDPNIIFNSSGFVSEVSKITDWDSFAKKLSTIVSKDDLGTVLKDPNSTIGSLKKHPVGMAAYSFMEQIHKRMEDDTSINRDSLSPVHDKISKKVWESIKNDELIHGFENSSKVLKRFFGFRERTLMIGKWLLQFDKLEHFIQESFERVLNGHAWAGLLHELMQYEDLLSDSLSNGSIQSPQSIYDHCDQKTLENLVLKKFNSAFATDGSLRCKKKQRTDLTFDIKKLLGFTKNSKFTDTIPTTTFAGGSTNNKKGNVGNNNNNSNNSDNSNNNNSMNSNNSNNSNGQQDKDKKDDEKDDDSKDYHNIEDDYIKDPFHDNSDDDKKTKDSSFSSRMAIYYQCNNFLLRKFRKLKFEDIHKVFGAGIVLNSKKQVIMDNITHIIENTYLYSSRRFLKFFRLNFNSKDVYSDLLRLTPHFEFTASFIDWESTNSVQVVWTLLYNFKRGVLPSEFDSYSGNKDLLDKKIDDIDVRSMKVKLLHYFN